MELQKGIKYLILNNGVNWFLVLKQVIERVPTSRFLRNLESKKTVGLGSMRVDIVPVDPTESSNVDRLYVGAFDPTLTRPQIIPGGTGWPLEVETEVSLWLDWLEKIRGLYFRFVQKREQTY